VIEATLPRIENLVARVDDFARRIVPLEAAWSGQIPQVLNLISTGHQYHRTLTRRLMAADQSLSEMQRAVSEHAQRLDRLTADIEGERAERETLLRSVPPALHRIERQVRDLEAFTEQARRVGTSVETRLAPLFAPSNHPARPVAFASLAVLPGMRNRHFPQRTEQPLLQPRIVNPDKVMQARASGLKLNLGCGYTPLEGYVNINRQELPGVGIIVDVSNLPFGQTEIDEIHSTHLLMHFPQEQLRRKLLPYWWGLLKPSGHFSAVVPDAAAMIREYAAGAYPYEALREVMYGPG
jgi:hypothetical protein